MIGATINQTGAFRFRATKVGRDTMLAQIIGLVEQAQASKAPIQRLADLVASYFVPAAVFIAIGTFVIWFDVGPVAGVHVRPRERGLGADHRVPLRARARDAAVDHGRDR